MNRPAINRREVLERGEMKEMVSKPCEQEESSEKFKDKGREFGDRKIN